MVVELALALFTAALDEVAQSTLVVAVLGLVAFVAALELVTCDDDELSVALVLTLAQPAKDNDKTSKVLSRIIFFMISTPFVPKNVTLL